MCRKKEEGSETKQEVICMKSAWRRWIAKLSNAITLGLFNFPLIIQTMVSYWMGRAKVTFQYDPCGVLRMKGGNPELYASSLGKERGFCCFSPVVPQQSCSSPAQCIPLLPDASPSGRADLLLCHTASTALGPLQATKILHLQVKGPSWKPALLYSLPHCAMEYFQGLPA